MVSFLLFPLRQLHPPPVHTPTRAPSPYSTHHAPALIGGTALAMSDDFDDELLALAGGDDEVDVEEGEA